MSERPYIFDDAAALEYKRLDLMSKILDSTTALLDDPSYWTQCWMMTAVWARKPVVG